MIRSMLLGLILLTAVTPIVLQPSFASAQDSDVTTLRRKQYTQQQAQALTRQLVSQVLDLQAAQLKQNGLTTVPIYNDITQMRENLDELIGNEMQGVVQKLILAQEVEGQDRINAITEARAEVRKVLLTLMAERQRLYRRMRLARLHAQVRELISVQESVSSQTRELPQLPMESRDEAALGNLSRQTDAVMMFHHLEEALLDMRSWGGSLANSAITGQQILKENNASDEVQGALTSIREGRYSGASVHQDAFVAALYKILEDLQQAQGLADNSLDSAMNEIEKLKDQQEEVKAETNQEELTPEKADELSQKQESIQKKLEELAKQMASQPENAEAVEEASNSAAEAVAELFEGDQESALEKQDEVLAKLETLKDQLLEQAVPPNVASADEREEQIAALETAKQELEKALDQQKSAEEQFEKAPETAEQIAQMERDAGQALDEAAQTENLPEAVKPMIAEAKAMANDAAAQAEKASQENSDSQTQDALSDASDATQQALENVSSTLADAKRQQLATKIGELARAAEALDRAAAAQQEISRDAAKVANDPQQSQNQDMQALAETQSDIAAVANRVAEGTKNTAPDAAEALKKAQAQIDKASDAAKAMAQDQQSPEAQGKSAQKLQSESQQAQQKLNDAAKALRSAAKEAAQQLAQTAGEQIDQIDSVDKSLGEMPAQKEASAAEAQMEALANEAGMISPEAAARLRQSPNKTPQSNEMAANNSASPMEASAENSNAATDSQDMSEASESSSGEMSEGNAQPMPAEPGSPADPMNSANSPMESQSSPTTSTPEERQNQVQQARAELAGRRQPIVADKQAAEQIAQLLDNIDNSGAKIQELSEQLMANNQAAENATQPMGDGEPSNPENGEGSQPMPSESSSGNVDPSNATGEASGEAPADQETQPNPIASQLAESMRQFANSQREATQLAANTAQQNQIANQPVRDALQTASRLPVPMSQMNQPAEGNFGDEAAAEGTAPSSEAEGQPGDTTQEPGSPADGSPMGSTPSEPSSNPTQSGTLASQESPNQQPSGEMGNSMVSPTPQVTAQALAGMEAMESLWDQMPELIADGDPSDSNEVATIDPLGMAAPASAMLDNPSASQSATPADATAQNAMQGQPTNNQPSNSQASTSPESMPGSESSEQESPGGSGTSNSNPAARSFEKEPWFTKLPPGVQQSIRASVRRSAPPGYEERLRRYFENID